VDLFLRRGVGERAREGEGEQGRRGNKLLPP
jgi:hypothetical protein